MIIKKILSRGRKNKYSKVLFFPVNERLIPFYGSSAAFWRATTTKRPSSVW